ncbi:hypothetical protein PRK78_006461 [Emydomyces testavorans]|uniref:Uncharacterized protein n=1 Tax=Emydomyces testavorans TaxID=2070801 RepID=A0AAF0ILP0_9EURO|nr:hypothetical protein PRK78_006461 [Emydomyces testavorans]
MSRIEAAVKVYAALLRQESVRKDVMKKMMSMLLHPYPKIRSTTAECLFMETKDNLLRKGDWLLPPKQLKDTVDSLRRHCDLS